MGTTIGLLQTSGVYRRIATEKICRLEIKERDGNIVIQAWSWEIALTFSALLRFSTAFRLHFAGALLAKPHTNSKPAFLLRKSAENISLDIEPSFIYMSSKIILKCPPMHAIHTCAIMSAIEAAPTNVLCRHWRRTPPWYHDCTGEQQNDIYRVLRYSINQWQWYHVPTTASIRG